MSEDLNITVGKELITPILEQKISAAIVRELGSVQEVVADAVGRVLNMKVDSQGKEDTYGYHNSQSLIQYHCKNLLRQAAENALAEFVASNEKRIRAEVKKQFQKHLDKVSAQLVLGLVDKAKQSYRFDFKVEVREPKED